MDAPAVRPRGDLTGSMLPILRVSSWVTAILPARCRPAGCCTTAIVAFSLSVLNACVTRYKASVHGSMPTNSSDVSRYSETSVLLLDTYASPTLSQVLRCLPITRAKRDTCNECEQYYEENDRSVRVRIRIRIRGRSLQRS